MAKREITEPCEEVISLWSMPGNVSIPGSVAKKLANWIQHQGHVEEA